MMHFKLNILHQRFHLLKTELSHQFSYIKICIKLYFTIVTTRSAKTQNSSQTFFVSRISRIGLANRILSRHYPCFWRKNEVRLSSVKTIQSIFSGLRRVCTAVIVFTQDTANAWFASTARYVTLFNSDFLLFIHYLGAHLSKCKGRTRLEVASKSAQDHMDCTVSS